MALPPAGDPLRFDRDSDQELLSWFYYDGDNRGKVSRIQKERLGRWREWERLEVLKQKEKDDEVLRKKKEEDDQEKMEEDDKEKEQKQTEAVEADFKRARTSS